MDLFSEKIIDFLLNLSPDFKLPSGIRVMMPARDPGVKRVISEFYSRYYSDKLPRTLMLGINPGRFGAGVTGITFTDPIRLEKECGISNPFEKKPELSSVFIYEMINCFGGPEKVFAKFYLTAVCPLGFIKNGRNMNYYDDKNLESAVRPFIVDSIRKQVTVGCSTKAAICLGEGKNFSFFLELNNEFRFFDRIIPLAHPRFIMQYRLKRKEEYLEQYIRVLKDAGN